MIDATNPVPPGMPPPRRDPLFGNRAYAAAVDEVAARTLSQLRVFDRSLGREYNDEARCERLRALLLADRANRVRIVVHDATHLRRDCPRLMSLLRLFGHGLIIYRTQSLARGVYDPFCIADGSHYARRFHFDNPRGVLALDDYEEAANLVQRFEEIWEASQPAISATTLGL